MKVSVPRAKPELLPEGRVWRTASSSRPGVYHYTFELVGMDTWCTCEGFEFNQKCRHVEDIYADASTVSSSVESQWPSGTRTGRFSVAKPNVPNPSTVPLRPEASDDNDSPPTAFETMIAEHHKVGECGWVGCEKCYGHER